MVKMSRYRLKRDLGNQKAGTDFKMTRAGVLYRIDRGWTVAIGNIKDFNRPNMYFDEVFEEITEEFK